MLSFVFNYDWREPFFNRDRGLSYFSRLCVTITISDLQRLSFTPVHKRLKGR